MTFGYTDSFPKRRLWREVCEIYNGKFEIFLTNDNIKERHSIIIPFDGYSIDISESDTHPLKFSFILKYLKDYELIVSRKDFFGEFILKFSKSKALLGDKDFENKHLVESDDMKLTNTLFNKEIRLIYLKHNIYSLYIHTD